LTKEEDKCPKELSQPASSFTSPGTVYGFTLFTHTLIKDLIPRMVRVIPTLDDYRINLACAAIVPFSVKNNTKVFRTVIMIIYSIVGPTPESFEMAIQTVF
jgi:hypothetical protein